MYLSDASKSLFLPAEEGPNELINESLSTICGSVFGKPSTRSDLPPPHTSNGLSAIMHKRMPLDNSFAMELKHKLGEFHIE